MTVKTSRKNAGEDRVLKQMKFQQIPKLKGNKLINQQFILQYKIVTNNITSYLNQISQP